MLLHWPLCRKCFWQKASVVGRWHFGVGSCQSIAAEVEDSRQHWGLEEACRQCNADNDNNSCEFGIWRNWTTQVRKNWAGAGCAQSSPPCNPISHSNPPPAHHLSPPLQWLTPKTHGHNTFLYSNRNKQDCMPWGVGGGVTVATTCNVVGVICQQTTIQHMHEGLSLASIMTREPKKHTHWHTGTLGIAEGSASNIETTKRQHMVHTSPLLAAVWQTEIWTCVITESSRYEVSRGRLCAEFAALQSNQPFQPTTGPPSIPTTTMTHTKDPWA